MEYDINKLVKLIESWANDRNLIQGSDPKTQLLKTMSELGELADGINKGNREKIIDGIGDTIVTLVIVCKQLDLDIGECINDAYRCIKDRKGRMHNGCFIKESDEEF